MDDLIVIEVKASTEGYDTIVTMGSRCTITPWFAFKDANSNALMACEIFSNVEKSAAIMREIEGA